MKLLIGSKALNHYFPDFKLKLNSDTDYAVEDNRKYNFEKNIEYLNNPILIDKYKELNCNIISPEDLLSLKISHMFWNINWEKHLYHIQFLLNKGVKYDLELINKLIQYWQVTHKKIKRSNLESNKEEFFTNAVNEDTEQHDYIHTLINPIPMYTLLLKDGAEVELDENKFNNLNFEQKKDVIFEETAVMAWERYKKTNYIAAYKNQLKDNIIKHFPFYIALFAIENYPKLERPKFNYIETINNKLNHGIKKN